MSDPIAVSILSKLTSWYTHDSVTTDAHGSYDLTIPGAAYSAGLKGQQLNKNVAGSHVFSSPPSFSAAAGQYTIGGWFNFTSGSSGRPEFGLFYPTMTQGAEAFVIVVHPDGYFYAVTWHDSGVNASVVQDPLTGAVNYPVTLQVEDSAAQTATSEQVIRIVSGGTLQPGRYFVVATWDAGNRALYIDSVLVDTNTPPAAVKQSTLGRIGIGRDAGSTASTLTDQDECFVCMDAVFAQDEIAWLFNSGAGRSYADVVAAAA
jgi:hypothetical protein